MKKCPICGYEFKNQRGVLQHQSTSPFCKYQGFGKMMLRKEGMARIDLDGNIHGYARLRRVEVYEDKNGNPWVPLWFLQVLKEHSSTYWKHRESLPKEQKNSYNRARSVTTEGRKMIIEAKKNARMRGALTLKFRLGNTHEDFVVGDRRYWSIEGQPWDKAAMAQAHRNAKKYGKKIRKQLEKVRKPPY